MRVKKHRDLTLIDINEKQLLVISSDSSGGIGNKKNDVVKTDPEIVGYFAAQVSLMELIALGAKPISVIDTLSVEMEDTGRRILNGIKEALKPLDLDVENVITGSTEENFPVSVTGMGITIIGIIDKESFLWPETNRQLIAVVVGLPKVGDEILKDRNNIMSVGETLKLKEKFYIKEILPVGSKGILYELKEVARTNGLEYTLEDNISIDLYKSGGPSTCVIVSIKEEDIKKLKEETDLPIEKIGRFI